MGFQIGSNHPSNHPDIVLYDFHQQEIFFIDISCSADFYVSTKEDEKINKYCSLVADFHQMYNMPAIIIPVVLGCTGMVSSYCLVFRENPRVHTESVWPLSCADWVFTSIKNNIHSLMNCFLCNCTCHSAYH